MVGGDESQVMNSWLEYSILRYQLLTTSKTMVDELLLVKQSLNITLRKERNLFTRNRLDTE